MAEGKLDSADFEDSPLPGAETPDFDLSDETSAADGNGVSDEQQPEKGSQGEPEGIFALFDREFPEEGREPIEPEESSEFDAEFSEEFEEMFTAIKGDGSAPLFEEQPEPIVSETLSDEPPTAGSPIEEYEDNVLPIPGSEPKRIAPKLASSEEEDELPFPGEAGADPVEVEEPLILDLYDDEDEIPLVDPSAPLDGASDFESLNMDPDLPLEAAEEPLADDFLSLDEPSLELDSPAPDSNLSLADDYDEPDSELAAWNSEDESLEELSFDDSDEDELFDIDLATPDSGDEEDDDEEAFDEFTRMAMGFEDEDDEDSIDEEDDFKVEELSDAPELDPFEDIAIMSSEDVAKYQPGFGEEELKFQDETPLPEDPDPFSIDGEDDPKFSGAEDGYDPLKEIDPFSEEAAALAEDKADESPKSDSADGDEPEKDEKEEKPKKERKSRGGGSKGPGLMGILLFPWRIYSTFTTILFGLIEGFIGILAKIPLIGIPFRMLGSVLSAIPMALKRIIVLAVIAAIAWGGTSLINSFLPKPTADISLPDSGSARFIDVELKDGTVTGELENTGDVNLLVFPQVKVFERQIFNPGTWFSPTEKGVCGGDLIEVAIDATAKVSYSCDIPTDGIISIEPMLKD